MCRSTRVVGTTTKSLVLALKKQLQKVVTKNAKLEAEKLAALELVRARNRLNPPPKPKPMSEIEIARRIAFADELKRRGEIPGKPFLKRKP